MKIPSFIKGLTSKKTELKKCNMIFDWELAAQIISYTKPYIAYEVLEDAPRRTGDVIYQGGIHVNSKAICSQAKRPMIVIDSNTPIPCFKLMCETDEIGSWTKNALRILEGKT